MLSKEKQAHVKAWKRSGLTKTAYCGQQGLNLKTFIRWCGQVRRLEASNAKLLPVEMVPQEDVVKSIRLKLPSGGQL